MFLHNFRSPFWLPDFFFHPPGGGKFIIRLWGYFVLCSCLWLLRIVYGKTTILVVASHGQEIDHLGGF